MSRDSDRKDERKKGAAERKRKKINNLKKTKKMKKMGRKASKK
jgi:hypothetical protein